MTEKQLQQYQALKGECVNLENFIASIAKYGDSYPAQKTRENYQEKVRQLHEQLDEIENAIAKLEPRERQLLRLHYIQGLTWEEVGEKMYYERSQVYRIRTIALKALENV